MTVFVVGLTGGIGSGKSAAAAVFAELGAAVVDVDVIAHELTGPNGAAMAAIRAEFTESVVAANGSLDRAAMRQLAFSDAAARKRLEAILHPLIRTESERRCAAATAAYALLVVPLLVEAGEGYRRRVARVAVVDCREETQIARAMARSGLTREDAERIIAAQASRAARLAIADDIIDNDGNLLALRRQVEALNQRYSGLAAAAAA